MNPKLKYDYFVASRWRNRVVVLDLVEKLRAKGEKVYNFFEAADAIDRKNNDPETVMRQFEALDWQHDPFVKQVFDDDLKALKKAKELIMLLPAGKSAHMEAGVAFGMGKNCILIGKQVEAESLYLIFSEVYNSIEDFVLTLEEGTGSFGGGNVAN